MPCLEGMHSPGSETAHLLPPAGMRTNMAEVYRFHRVIPYYPPDPCIRPTEADLVCPPDNSGPNSTRNYANMAPAGVSTMPISDRFAFYKAREGSSKRPCHPGDKQRAVEEPCPCSNRCPVLVRQRPYDLNYMYPACVNRPRMPSVVTPLFHEPSPYIRCPTTSPDQQSQWAPQPCRRRFSKHLLPHCPNSDPSVGPMFGLLVRCAP